MSLFSGELGILLLYICMMLSFLYLNLGFGVLGLTRCQLNKYGRLAKFDSGDHDRCCKQSIALSFNELIYLQFNM